MDVAIPAQHSRFVSLNLVLDIVFGVIPALIFGLLSAEGVVAATLSLWNGDSALSWSGLGLITLAVVGLYANLSLLFVVFRRGKVPALQRLICLGGLGVGAVVALFYLTWMVALLVQGQTNGGAWGVVVLLFSVAAIAIRYIRVLTARRII